MYLPLPIAACRYGAWNGMEWNVLHVFLLLFYTYTAHTDVMRMGPGSYIHTPDGNGPTTPTVSTRKICRYGTEAVGHRGWLLH